MERISWDEYFLRIAGLVKERSHDQETKVGAVIVDGLNRIISTGYNGHPPKLEGLPTTRPDKYEFILHAEMNAILSSRCDLTKEDATLYVTLVPCQQCSLAIITSRIKRVVYLNYRSQNGLHLLEQAGILTSRLEERLLF